MIKYLFIVGFFLLLGSFAVANELRFDTPVVINQSTTTIISSGGTTFNTANFTGLYDGRTDRFGNSNFTSQLNSATGQFLQNNTPIQVSQLNNSGEITKIGKRLRIGGNYSASPADPNIGEADIMIVDNGITPTLRIRYNMNGVMKVADVALA